MCIRSLLTAVFAALIFVVPPFKATAPLNEFAPPSVTVPLPNFVKPKPPPTAPFSTRSPEPPMTTWFANNKFA